VQSKIAVVLEGRQCCCCCCCCSRDYKRSSISLHSPVSISSTCNLDNMSNYHIGSHAYSCYFTSYLQREQCMFASDDLESYEPVNESHQSDVITTNTTTDVNQSLSLIDPFLTTGFLLRARAMEAAEKKEKRKRNKFASKLRRLFRRNKVCSSQ